MNEAMNLGRLKKQLEKLYRYDGKILTCEEMIKEFEPNKKIIYVQKYSTKKICLEYKELKSTKRFYSIANKESNIIDIPKIVWDSLDLPEKDVPNEL